MYSSTLYVLPLPSFLCNVPLFQIHKFPFSYMYSAPIDSFYVSALFYSVILRCFLLLSLFSYINRVFVTYTLDYTASYPVKE